MNLVRMFGMKDYVINENNHRIEMVKVHLAEQGVQEWSDIEN